MFVKICQIDFDNKLAHVCDAADFHSYHNEIGRMYVRWHPNTAPILGKTYSMTPKISWFKGNKTILLHGVISSIKPIEDQKFLSIK